HEGANVVLAARRKEKLGTIAEEINTAGEGQALAVPTNVANRSEVEAMVKKAAETFGDIDIYVNNAGLMLDARVREGKVEEWEQMIEFNIKGSPYSIKAQTSTLINQLTGQSINNANVYGKQGKKISTVNSATKFA